MNQVEIFSGEGPNRVQCLADARMLVNRWMILHPASAIVSIHPTETCNANWREEAIWHTYTILLTYTEAAS